MYVRFKTNKNANTMHIRTGLLSWIIGEITEAAEGASEEFLS